MVPLKFDIKLKSTLLFILPVIALVSCQNNTPTPEEIALKPSSVYKRIYRADVDEVVEDPCNITPSEYTDWYELTTEIPRDLEEHSILADALEEKGFTQSFFGRGEHPDGPRVYYFRYKSESCQCEIEKLYVNTKVSGTYAVVERIACK